jgi:hypothetical protein
LAGSFTVAASALEDKSAPRQRREGRSRRAIQGTARAGALRDDAMAHGEHP